MRDTKRILMKIVLVMIKFHKFSLFNQQKIYYNMSRGS